LTSRRRIKAMAQRIHFFRAARNACFISSPAEAPAGLDTITTIVVQRINFLRSIVPLECVLLSGEGDCHQILGAPSLGFSRSVEHNSASEPLARQQCMVFNDGALENRLGDMA
jgi:hypothetical protein